MQEKPSIVGQESTVLAEGAGEVLFSFFSLVLGDIE